MRDMIQDTSLERKKDIIKVTMQEYPLILNVALKTYPSLRLNSGKKNLMKRMQIVLVGHLVMPLH